MAECLPQDFMHDVIEGVLFRMIILLLHQLCVEDSACTLTKLSDELDCIRTEALTRKSYLDLRPLDFDIPEKLADALQMSLHKLQLTGISCYFRIVSLLSVAL